MRNLVVSLSVFCLLVTAPGLFGWEPVGNHIKTRWASMVDPASCLPEYPRPQMVRQQWENLNGLWNYSIAAEDESQPQSFEGQILVPFCIESSLSGVGKALEPGQALWYEREFRVPADWKGRRIRLNFGAVDWKAEVYVNGNRVGEHTGGFAPFSFDITEALNRKGPQRLVVKVIDPTDGGMVHPVGKQRLHPEAIWYSAVSGIWQTVWIEPVHENGIKDWYAVSDPDAGTVGVDVSLLRQEGGETVEVEILEGGVGYSTDTPSDGNVLARASGVPGSRILLHVDAPRLWSPEDPYLYGIRIKVVRWGKVLDKVEGYTQIRKISVLTTPDGYKRMGLNGKALFQFGPLDQGWWPDGLYTAPTDGALEYDILKTKDFGFNMIRKHVKTESSRWYYHCDRLGVLVWQDMPSMDAPGGEWADDKFEGGRDCDVPQEAKTNFFNEWKEIVSSLKGFQCIVVWVPFNESWGQFDTEKVASFTRQLDPTRLINPASGGNHFACGDILDFHHYPEPKMHFFRSEYVNVQGEYGVRAVSPEWGHTWLERDRSRIWWSPEDIQNEYDRFAQILKKNISEGCSAAVYCQTTDVEDEINGFMTYDREIVKFRDQERLRRVNREVIATLDLSVPRKYVNPAGDEFPIAAYNYSQATPEIYRQLHDAGFNLDVAHGRGCAMSQLDAAQGTGVKAIVEIDSLDRLAGRLPKDHPALAGYFVLDEPRARDLQWVKKMVEELRSSDDDHLLYINLLPSYTGDWNKKYDLTAERLGGTYDHYLDMFVDGTGTGLLSYDFYPIVDKDGRVFLKQTYYRDLFDVSRKALQKGIPFWAFTYCENRRDFGLAPAKREWMRMQIFSDLAFGAQGVQYFSTRGLFEDGSVAPASQWSSKIQLGVGEYLLLHWK